MSQKHHVMHGRDHDPEGSDPIPSLVGGIRFDVDNEGGFLYVVSNDSTDISYGERGLLFADTSEAGILLVAQDAGNTIQGTFSVTDAEVRLSLSSGPYVAIDRATGSVKARLTTGGTFSVLDNGGSPIFRVDEDGDVHILTGKTVTADL